MVPLIQSIFGHCVFLQLLCGLFTVWLKGILWMSSLSTAFLWQRDGKTILMRFLSRRLEESTAAILSCAVISCQLKDARCIPAGCSWISSFMCSYILHLDNMYNVIQISKNWTDFDHIFQKEGKIQIYKNNYLSAKPTNKANSIHYSWEKPIFIAHVISEKWKSQIVWQLLQAPAPKKRGAR